LAHERSQASIVSITVPVTTLVGALTGCLFALVCRRVLIRVPDPVRTRYFAIVVLFAAAVLLPAGLAFYLAFPDWSLMYLANPAHLPGWMVWPVLIIFYLAGSPIFFLITARLMVEPKPWPLRSLLIGLSVFLLATLVLGFDRLTTVAYYEAYHHRLSTIALTSSALLLPLILAIGAFGGVLYFSLRHIRRHLELVQDLPRLRTDAASADPLGIAATATKS
jgi:hypothetical protein